jgi:hypothetical protein
MAVGMTGVSEEAEACWVLEEDVGAVVVVGRVPGVEELD